MFTRKLTVVLLFCAVLTGWTASAWLQGPRPAQAETAYAELQLFTDVLSIVRRSYVEEVPVKDLVYGAIDGMLASLDPHSGFMPPEVYKEMKIDTRGEFGGLGIEITLKDDILTIVTPIEDTPAFRAGLAAGDRILKIDDQFTKGMEIMEAVRLMRGAPGTDVTIAVMREGFEKPEGVHPQARSDQDQERQVQNSGRRLWLCPGHPVPGADRQRPGAGPGSVCARRTMADLKGLVVDLRNNPGGLLDQAVEVADLFLAEGLIVYTKGREADAQMEFSAKRSGTEPAYPIVVLINGGSASASEIVAGALQDHGRAVILGVQSFGKGSVQTILPLGDDSGLRLTTARYYTPKGTSIQAKGIVPDIEVQQVGSQGGRGTRALPREGPAQPLRQRTARKAGQAGGKERQPFPGGSGASAATIS